jgi:hypothetical protein
VALAAKKAAAFAANKPNPLGNAATLVPFNGVRAAYASQFAIKLHPTIAAYQQNGLTQRAIVAELNAVGIKTAMGNDWSLVQLQRVISRIAHL